MARQMKDSGIEWIGEIPATWRICRLKDIADIYNGNSIKDEEKLHYEDPLDAIPYIATKDIDISSHAIDYSNGMYVKQNDTTFRKAPADSSLMCIEGGSAGRKIAFTNQPVCFINKLCCFNSNVLNNRFLYYYLCSPSFAEEFRQHISGLIGGVSISEIKNFAFLWPCDNEQKRIVAFLDRKCAEIDAVIERTKATIEEYKKLKQAVITEAVTKGVRGPRPMKDSGIEWIGEAPADWQIKKVKWLLNERKDRSENGEEEPLSMSQKYGLIPTKEMDMIPNMASTFVGAKLVKHGDLVFNKLKAHLGVFAVSQYEGLVSPDYAVYFSTGLAHAKFLEYLFKTPQYIGEFRKKSSGVGAGLTRLYTDDLFSIACSLPSFEEQEEIVHQLDNMCMEMDTLIAKKTALLSELETYKKSLIYEYVTGKKEVIV